MNPVSKPFVPSWPAGRWRPAGKFLAVLVGLLLLAGGERRAAGQTSGDKPPYTFTSDQIQAITDALKDQRRQLLATLAALDTWDAGTRLTFQKWFGTTDPNAVAIVRSRVSNALDMNGRLGTQNFVPAASDVSADGKKFTAAYVYPYNPQKKDTVYLPVEFFTKLPAEKRPGVLTHEFSHFDAQPFDKDKGSLEGSDDVIYGRTKSLALDTLAKLRNADNLRFFTEDIGGFAAKGSPPPKKPDPTPTLPPDPFPGKAYKSPFEKDGSGAKPTPPQPGSGDAAKKKSPPKPVGTAIPSAPGKPVKPLPADASKPKSPQDRLLDGLKQTRPKPPAYRNPIVGGSTPDAPQRIPPLRDDRPSKPDKKEQGPFTVNYYRRGDYPKGGELDGVYKTREKAMQAVARLQRWAAQIDDPTWQIEMIEVIDESTGQKQIIRLGGGNSDKDRRASPDPSPPSPGGASPRGPRPGFSLTPGIRRPPEVSRPPQRPEVRPTTPTGTRKRGGDTLVSRDSPRNTPTDPSSRRGGDPGTGKQRLGTYQPYPGGVNSRREYDSDGKAPPTSRYSWLLGDKKGNLSPQEIADIRKNPQNYFQDKSGKWYYDPSRKSQDGTQRLNTSQPYPGGQNTRKTYDSQGNPVGGPRRPTTDSGASPGPGTQRLNTSQPYPGGQNTRKTYDSQGNPLGGPRRPTTDTPSGVTRPQAPATPLVPAAPPRAFVPNTGGPAPTAVPNPKGVRMLLQLDPKNFKKADTSSGLKKKLFD